MKNKKLETPKIVIGTWAWGDTGELGNGYFGSKLEKNDLQKVASKAIKAGFTMWDTAAVYGMGHSEQVLGEVLKQYDRNDYQLSTKFTPQIAEDVENPVETMLEGSLKRLNTDYIDLYWIHNPKDVEKWTPYLIPLLKEGKIKHVGVSNHNLQEIKQVNEILGEAGYKIDAIQNHYSLLYRSSEKAGLIEYCQENNIDFYSYMVLEQGALTGKYDSSHPFPEGSTRAEIYNPMMQNLESLNNSLKIIAEKHQASAADIATAWAIQKGTTPIIGITKSKYIDDEIKVTNIRLSSEEMNMLEKLGDLAQVNTRGEWEKDMNIN